MGIIPPTLAFREDHLAHISLFVASRSQRFIALTTASSLALCVAQPAFAQTAEQPDEAVAAAETEDAAAVRLENPGAPLQTAIDCRQHLRRETAVDPRRA